MLCSLTHSLLTYSFFSFILRLVDILIAAFPVASGGGFLSFPFSLPHDTLYNDVLRVAQVYPAALIVYASAFFTELGVSLAPRMATDAPLCAAIARDSH